MAGKSYTVVAEYVTLRSRNELGQEVLLGYHRGALLPESVNREDLERHLRKGMVAAEGSPEAELLGTPAGTPVPGEPPNVPVTEGAALNLSPEDRARRAQDAVNEAKQARGRRSARGEDTKSEAPAGNASREEWAAHATSKGAPAEETRPVEEGGLKQTELRAKYGG